MRSSAAEAGASGARPSRELSPLTAAGGKSPGTLGLIAGGGRFPVLVAESAKRQGYRLVCIGHRQFTSPEIARLADEYTNLGLGRLGAAIRFFKRHGATEVSWAGWIRKERLFLPWRWLSILPDWRMARLWYFQLKDRQDATLLSALAGEFSRDGIEVVHSVRHAPDLLAEEGVLTRRAPTRAELDDVRYGWTVARRLANLDVGQSAVVRSGSTLAVEGIEGTDRNIRRAGELALGGGLVVVKLAKDDHDMRFDVPTIGPDTVDVIVRAGGSVLAIEAQRTLILDREEVVERANRSGLAVISIRTPDGIAAGGDSRVRAEGAACTPELEPLHRRLPPRAQLEDLRFGARVAGELSSLDVGTCVAVREKSTLAVEAAEGRLALVRRSGELCRRGGFSLVLRASQLPASQVDALLAPEVLAEARARGCLALGIMTGLDLPALRATALAREADARGLAVVAVREPVHASEEGVKVRGPAPGERA